jgi:hypothetical protein
VCPPFPLANLPEVLKRSSAPVKHQKEGIDILRGAVAFPAPRAGEKSVDFIEEVQGPDKLADEGQACVGSHFIGRHIEREGEKGLWDHGFYLVGFVQSGFATPFYQIPRGS